jgi:hypothetical protein
MKLTRNKKPSSIRVVEIAPSFVARKNRSQQRNRISVEMRRVWSRNSFGVMSLAELPDGVLLNILKQTDYDVPLAFRLLGQSRRIRTVMLGERGMRGFPRFVVKKLLTCVMTPPFSAPYLELNIDRILLVMDADNEFKRALRGTILEVAENPADPLHDALVVRAQLFDKLIQCFRIARNFNHGDLIGGVRHFSSVALGQVFIFSFVAAVGFNVGQQQLAVDKLTGFKLVHLNHIDQAAELRLNLLKLSGIGIDNNGHARNRRIFGGAYRQ